IPCYPWRVCHWWPSCSLLFFFTPPAPTHIYTLSLHDALPILIRGRAERLNGLSQAHFAGTGSGRALSRIAGSRAGHVRVQAIESYPKILAHVGCRNALANVLESLTGLLCRHSRQLLDFAGNGGVDLQRTAHRCSMDTAAFAVPVPMIGGAHVMAHAVAMPHPAP